MFSIGEFARHGRVSVRMLRHYDAIGLRRNSRRRVEAYLVKLTSRCLPEANKRGILIG